MNIGNSSAIPNRKAMADLEGTAQILLSTFEQHFFVSFPRNVAHRGLSFAIADSTINLGQRLSLPSQNDDPLTRKGPLRISHDLFIEMENIFRTHSVFFHFRSRKERIMIEFSDESWGELSPTCGGTVSAGY
jgi:hypothetical protein